MSGFSLEDLLKHRELAYAPSLGLEERCWVDNGYFRKESAN